MLQTSVVVNAAETVLQFTIIKAMTENSEESAHSQILQNSLYDLTSNTLFSSLTTSLFSFFPALLHARVP